MRTNRHYHTIALVISNFYLSISFSFFNFFSKVHHILCFDPPSQTSSGLSSYTSKHFFCISKFFLNSPNTLWPFKKTHRHHTSKNTSESQNIWLPEVKIYHRKSTSGSQKSLPEVYFQKSKNIIRSRLRKIKKHYGSRLP